MNTDISIKNITAALGVIMAVLALAGTVESRYAVASQVDQSFNTLKKDFRDVRLQALDNEIFKLTFKQANTGLTPLEKALLNRYKIQINNIRNSK